MDPTIPTPTVCSTVTTSSISMQAPPPTPLHLLEISLISAQDLMPVSKSMRTYAVAWTNPSRKLTTRTNQHGHTHPTWNEKLTFRVDSQFLLSDDAAITVEIYTVSWFREVLVGTVRVLISDLLTPPSGVPLQQHPKSMRFVALQVRRPSGAPQGILNMGVALLDSSMRSMPLNNDAAKTPGEDFQNAIEKKVNDLSLEQQKDGYQEENEKKIHLWRSLSLGSEINEEFPSKTGSIYNPGSVVNGSVCNGSSVLNGGSELCSDIGPSASIVAAELAMKSQPPPQAPAKRPINRTYDDTGSSILEELTFEEAKAKGYRIRTNRWRKQVSSGKHDYDTDSDLSSTCSRHSRRNSDGGLFSCFVYGIEFTIVCGASNQPSSKRPSNSASRKSIKPSETNSD